MTLRRGIQTGLCSLKTQLWRLRIHQNDAGILPILAQSRFIN